jgi:hypothetical protein
MGRTLDILKQEHGLSSCSSRLRRFAASWAVLHSREWRFTIALANTGFGWGSAATADTNFAAFRSTNVRNAGIGLKRFKVLTGIRTLR